MFTVDELQITVNCVYTIAESAGIPVIPMARVLSCSPALSACTSTACGSGLIFCSRRIVPRLFCCTERSRSLTETIALIWIIKGVRHYDTVSLCRGGQHTNIQAHCPYTTISPSSSHYSWSWPGINYRHGLGHECSRLVWSSLVYVTSSIGVSEKNLLGPTDTCLIWHPPCDESWAPQSFQ